MSDNATVLDPTTHQNQATGSTLSPTPPRPHLPPYIANNLVFTIHYNVDRCKTDTIEKLIFEHFNEEDIQLAYLVSSDFFPEDFRKTNRSCKVSTPTKQLSTLISWLQTASPTPQIFAPLPYDLPPPDIKDLSPVTSYITAKKALLATNSYQAGFREQLESLNVQMKLITDSFINTKCSTPPSPGATDTLTGTSPSVIAAGRAPPSPTSEAGGNNRPSSPLPPSPIWNETDQSASHLTPQDTQVTSAPQSLASDMGLEGRETFSDKGHSDRDRRRINRSHKRKEVPTPQEVPVPKVGPTPQQKTPDRQQRQKRCHKVLYNLPNTVREEEVKKRVKYLTGAEPIIIHRLPCKRRDSTAFRITCLYEHLDKLTADNFGSNVKVSRYNYAMDFPSLGNLHPTHDEPPQPTMNTQGAPTTSVNEDTATRNQPEVDALLRDYRNNS